MSKSNFVKKITTYGCKWKLGGAKLLSQAPCFLSNTLSVPSSDNNSNIIGIWTYQTGEKNSKIKVLIYVMGKTVMNEASNPKPFYLNLYIHLC